MEEERIRRLLATQDIKLRHGTDNKVKKKAGFEVKQSELAREQMMLKRKFLKLEQDKIKHGVVTKPTHIRRHPPDQPASSSGTQKRSNPADDDKDTKPPHDNDRQRRASDDSQTLLNVPVLSGQEEPKVTIAHLGRKTSLGHNSPQASRRALNEKPSQLRPGDHMPATLTEDDDDDETEKLRVLFNKAIATIQNTDETDFIDTTHKLSGDPPNQKQLRGSVKSQKGAGALDADALVELEAILSGVRVPNARRGSNEGPNKSDAPLDKSTKKRIEHLEEVLKRVNQARRKSDEIDPAQLLACGYLRLSGSNIETLEEMVRKMGKEPGIHAHSDVTNYDIWANLKEERADLKPQPPASTSEVPSIVLPSKRGKRS